MKRTLFVIACVLASITMFAQTDYYYYQGNKIPLTLNENKVVVSIPKENKEVSERIQANVQNIASISDNIYDIFVISRSEYEKLTTLDFWADDAKFVIITSCYFTENNEEFFSTPYLNVRLKKEEDRDLLTTYAEQYKLNIVSNSPSMPLWYILAVTLESEKSPLECANELYESGHFASSVPDLVSDLLPKYRPFIEDGKVWVLRSHSALGLPESSSIGYYYFDGDSIVDGHTCKIMKVVSDVTEDNWVNGVFTPGSLPQHYVGAFYEQDKKVYYTQYHSTFDQIYDFSLSSNDSFSSWGYLVVVQKMSGGIPGFKGTYYDLWRDDHIIGRWLEGIGCDTSYPDISHPWDYEGGGECILLACSVGDEVIYYNSEVEDPFIMGARKGRFDFTHTTKIQPKTPIRREKSDEGSQLHGEYSEQQLGIYLDQLDDAYVVCITDETGKPVYEKAINAGSIVALNIDISTYAEGCYTVTVENSQEIFTGEFQVQTTGIEENVKIEKVKNESIYNLQGQRISSLQKGLNIVNGQKVYIK